MIRRIVLPVFILFALFSCDPDPNDVVVDVPVDDTTTTTVGNTSTSIDDLLALFEPITADTIFVSTQTEDPNSDDFKFKGTPIPGNLAQYFDGLQAYATFDNATDIYATYKLQLDESRTLLFVRAAGEIWTSRVNLFVFDTSDGVFSGQKLEVADVFEGDSETVIRESIIRKIDVESVLLIDIQEQTCYGIGTDPTPERTNCIDSTKNWVFTVDNGFELLSSSEN